MRRERYFGLQSGLDPVADGMRGRRTTSRASSRHVKFDEGRPAAATRVFKSWISIRSIRIRQNGYVSMPRVTIGLGCRGPISPWMGDSLTSFQSPCQRMGERHV